ncbi:hypothetical protein [Aeromonas allosaccharophila]|uniref:hypothetical protein n=1 Tax=Aeromonas allosaccharophila TaxID=656 RepID=UPI001115F071|nr:hypothetical protein [Aeromonas allosaccharophila]TNI94689.1 hypothetical protein CF120_02050 [Aeromonas allosaccharophila]
MKKNILALSVVTALSSLALAGCGGGGDGSSTDNGNNGGNATKPAESATFIDSPVEGLAYTCGRYSAFTNKQGQFFFNDGDTCAFKLGLIPLGETQVKKGQALVTPYTIAEKGDKDRAIRIAALLQTMDADSDASNGINLKTEDVVKLGNTLRFDSDDAFNTSLNEALKAVQPGKKAVDTAAAAAHMNASLAKANGKSAAVDYVLRDLVEQNKHWEQANFENTLRGYKDRLSTEADEPGKADRQIMLAIIAMMEVTNDPIVSKRFDVEPSQVGQGYTTMLAKVLDAVINHARLTAKEATGNTKDVAELLAKYAVKMQETANSLGNIVNPEYKATYGDNDELTLSYDQVRALRASAIAMASGLNIMAAYQYGDDRHLQPKTEELSVPILNFEETGIAHIYDNPAYPSFWGDQNSWKHSLPNTQITAEYSDADVNPALLWQDPQFFVINQADRLKLARTQLAEAAKLTANLGNALTSLRLDAEEAKNTLKLAEALDKHLNGQQASVIVDSTNGNGISVKLDLNSFFSEGLDRNDVDVLVGEGTCEGNMGSYSEEYSKMMGNPVCGLNPAEVAAIQENRFWIMPQLSFKVEYTSDFVQNELDQTASYIMHVTRAPVVPYHPEVTLKPREGSTFGKVFLECRRTENGQSDVVDCAALQ